MPARSIATGTISFGLVSIPVRLFPATQPSASISFNMLHARDGSLAARPALFAMPQLGRQHQDDLQLTAGKHFRVGVQKDSIGAQIPGVARRLCVFSALDGDRHPGTDTRSGASFGFGLGHSELKTTRHENWRV